MASGFFPNLPDPVQPNPLVEAGKGYGFAQDISTKGLEADIKRTALGEHKEDRAAMQAFGQTGDTQELWKHNPEIAINMEKQLLSMDSARQDFALKALDAGVKETDQALPYFLSLAKTNPQQAAQQWPQFINTLKQMGLQPPPGTETFNVGTLQEMKKLRDDALTVKERVKAQGDLQKIQLKAAADARNRQITGEYNVRGHEISAESNIRGHEISAGASKYSADKRAEGGGKTGGKLTDYGTFRADYLEEHPGAPATEIRAAWSTSNQAGKPQKSGRGYSGGKPAGEQYLLPSAADPSQKISATKEQYDAYVAQYGVPK